MDDQLFDKLNTAHHEGKKQDDLDKLELKKQEKEAEALRAYFTEVLERNSSRQVDVKSITVTGGGSKSTRSDFLDTQLKPIFKAKNLNSLVSAIDEVYDNLASLGVYENISFSLDENKNGTKNQTNGLDHLNPFAGLFGSNNSFTDSMDHTKINLDATLKLIQAKRFYAKTGTDLGNGEGNGYANMTFKNIFGGAEILSLDATIGTRTRSSYIANFSTPVLSVLPPQWRLETLAYMTSRSIPWASNEQIVRGISAKVKSLKSHIIKPGNYSPSQQEFGIEAVWRTIACTPGASPSVRDEAGNSLKASIFHSLAYDTRDNLLMATRGNYFKISQELAGIGGIGNAFYKTSFESQHTWSFGPTKRTTLHLGSKSGLLWMLIRPSTNHLTPPPSNVIDRFYLGGPNDVRGFYTSGIGPRDQSDSLGGEALLATGVSLLTPIPRVNVSTPLRFHTFVNAGNLMALDRTNTSTTAPQLLTSTFSQLLTTPSISAGVGLLYCHPVARFELNLTLPLVARQNEAARKGLQFGVGLSFL